MRKVWLPMVAIAGLAACDRKEGPSKSPPISSASATPTRQSDPDGSNYCEACKVTLRDARCRYCGAILHREVGRPPAQPTFVCPKDGCAYNSTSRERCFAHPDTDLKAQWFACPTCGLRDGEAGKCPRCRRELQRDLRDE